MTYTADAASRAYGAANPSLTGSVAATGLVNGDTVSGVTSGTAAWNSSATTASNVGKYGITGSGLSGNSSNYNISFAQGTGNATALSVTPASLAVTYTADAASRAYGAANPSLTGSVSALGLVNGDQLSAITTGTAAWNSSANATSNIGKYSVFGSGLSGNSANYSFSFVQASNNGIALTVNPASLSVTANALRRDYGAANPALTYTSSGLVNGDSLSGALATSATTASSVGAYAIGQGTLSAGSNYALSYTGANLTVDPASLTVVANAQSKIYGSANPALTYTASGLVNGDTLSGALSTAATAASSVGSFAINQGTLAASTNYRLTYTGASLVINAATLTYVATPASRLPSGGNPAFTGSVTGFVLGETVATATTGTLSFTSPALSTSLPGLYPIIGSGLSAVNYVFVQDKANATALTINPGTTQFGSNSVIASLPTPEFSVPVPIVLTIDALNDVHPIILNISNSDGTKVVDTNCVSGTTCAATN